MPAGDGTGPRGMGPMTGRGAGYCGNYGAPGYVNPMPGRGFGMGRGRGWGGRGRGRGWGRFGYAPAWGAPQIAPYGAPPAAAYYQQPYGAPSPAQETAFLKAQAEGLKEQLDAISQRITELEQE
ncbi:MAG: hypothetical protein DRJ03_20510 [Chloroflexi bacterium]|nr:MAG: hypothetical protein DRJ03_20510 [Chloroflexota bacterium]